MPKIDRLLYFNIITKAGSCSTTMCQLTLESDSFLVDSFTLESALFFMDSFTVELDLLFADSLELDLFSPSSFTSSVGEAAVFLSSERWFLFSSHSRGTSAIGAGNRDSPRLPFEPQNSAQNVITQHSVVLNTHSSRLELKVLMAEDSFVLLK